MMVHISKDTHWAWVSPAGWAIDIFYLRRIAIKHIERELGWSWRKCRENGQRVVKVRVIPVNEADDDS